MRKGTPSKSPPQGETSDDQGDCKVQSARCKVQSAWNPTSAEDGGRALRAICRHYRYPSNQSQAPYELGFTIIDPSPKDPVLGEECRVQSAGCKGKGKPYGF